MIARYYQFIIEGSNSNKQTYPDMEEAWSFVRLKSKRTTSLPKIQTACLKHDTSLFLMKHIHFLTYILRASKHLVVPEYVFHQQAIHLNIKINLLTGK